MKDYLTNRAKAASWILANRDRALWFNPLSLTKDNPDPSAPDIPVNTAHQIFADLQASGLLIPYIEGKVAKGYQLNLGRDADWRAIANPPGRFSRIAQWLWASFLVHPIPLMIIGAVAGFSARELWDLPQERARERQRVIVEIADPAAERIFWSRLYLASLRGPTSVPSAFIRENYVRIVAEWNRTLMKNTMLMSEHFDDGEAWVRFQALHADFSTIDDQLKNIRVLQERGSATNEEVTRGMDKLKGFIDDTNARFFDFAYTHFKFRP